MLDAEEVAAIREAMGQAAQLPDTATPGPAQDRDATPIALIAEDRAAVQARPNGLKLASRWARLTKKQLGRMTGAKIDLDVLGAESVEATSLREEMMLSWTGCVGAADRAGTMLVAVSGPMIETLAARLLGAPNQEGQAQTDRTPSSVAMRLFESVGDSILRALCEAWREEQGCTAAIGDAARASRTRTEMTTDGIVLLVTLAVRGAAAGQIRIVCRPETLIAPTPPVEAVPAAPGLIEDALGAVPVEVAVELGRARLTLSELGALRPGAVITLDRFVDDPLPVEVQGVVKAHGRAMVARNAMAVEIAARKEAA